MLNAQTAHGFALRIEAIRRNAGKAEDEVLNELRAMPDYEQNQDKDLLEAVRLRLEAEALLSEAQTLIGAFDWIYDEERGENVRKAGPE